MTRARADHQELTRRCAARDRVGSGRAEERLDEKPVQPQTPRVAEFLETDPHRAMAGRRLRAVGAEEPIPPREREAEGAAGLDGDDRVVDPMHVGRHHEQAQRVVGRLRQSEIRVAEQRAGIEQHLEDHHGDRRGSECRDDGELVEHGQEHLDRMKAHARGHVEIQIRVVHAMEPPERRNGMQQHVLQIDRQIEGRHREQDHEPARERTAWFPGCWPDSAPATRVSS